MCIGVIAVCAGLFAQSARKPEFEVASIKRNVSGDYRQSGGMLPGGQFSGTNQPLVRLLSFAFGVPPDAIEGGPAWIHADRFDLIGKAGARTSDADIALMVQSLLEQEFKLEVHREQKLTRVLVLVTAKSGPNLRVSAHAETRLAEGSSGPPSLRDCRIENGTAADPRHRITCTGMSMAQLAEGLPIFGGSLIDRQVVDQTNLAQRYDFELAWDAGDDGSSNLVDAMEKQIGLKLEGRTLPMPVIVIDHAERLAVTP